jgi:beta-glucosidase
MDILAGKVNVPFAKGNLTFSQGYDSHSEGVDASLIDEAVKAAKNADAAVIFAGLPDSYESEGFDRGHINMPENQNTLIREVCMVQKNTVVVLHNGAPVAMPWINEVAAVLEMYLGGEGVAEAVVSLLYGDMNPSGKLAETFPLKLSDNPSYLNFPGYKDETLYREGVYVGYRYYDKKEMPVLFPFGHGLSYTTFVYSDININKTKMKDTETCTVTAKVKNSGARAGKEVVQLYVRNHGSGIDRPVREIKGFTKVSLEPGEEKTVSFTLDKRAFAYYETAVHDWVVASGEFVIELGSSSRDIRLEAPIIVESTTEIPVVFTRYSPIGDIIATVKGKEVLGKILANMWEQNGGLGSVNLGGGSAEMLAALMNEMPLTSLAGFGSMTEEQLGGLLTALNAQDTQ